MTLEADIKQAEILIKEGVRPRVGASFVHWFEDLKLVRKTENELVFLVGDAMQQVWLETGYTQVVCDVALEVLGGVYKVLFIVDEEDVDADESLASGKKASNRKEEKKEERKDVKKGWNSRLNRSFQFENFVVGTNNQFAHAAAMAVAEDPNVLYNPLFIHGESGLGKTHLMQAVGNAIERRRGVGSVVYLTGEEFTNEFIDALQNKTLDKFRKKYRKVEALLLDDVQFFAGKERSQEEFFHTFNALFDGKKHLVLSSDRPASEIENLEARLTSRFESGLTVELLTPSYETRVAILKRKREEFNVKVEDELIDFLAKRISKNVRRLEGALMRVATFVSLSGMAPMRERIEELLRDILKEEKVRAVTVKSIQEMVAEHFDVRLSDMTGKLRPARIALARQVAMYLSRCRTELSLVEIGQAFGGRDHGTVIHAVRTIEKKLRADALFEESVQRIEMSLTTGG